ncbi:Ribosome biogenesis protein 1 [Halocaridina rubra]|uniref:Ribosome biogenesis protein BOP1 homolog n=1 Tax=Halocaridina rubra TaxID=373956 RepID=A0AAN8WTJ3_HALRR
MSGKRKRLDPSDPKNISNGGDNDDDYLVGINDEGDSSDSEYEGEELEEEDDEEDIPFLDDLLEEEEESGEQQTDDIKKNQQLKPQIKKGKHAINSKSPHVSKDSLLEVSEEDVSEEGKSESEEEEEESDSDEDFEDEADSLMGDSDEGESIEEVEENMQRKEDNQVKNHIDRDSGTDCIPAKNTKKDTDLVKGLSSSKQSENFESSESNSVEESLSTEAPKEVADEYEYDSSDEEDLRNTIGNIPMNWYDDYPHIGYNLEGKPILKPDRLDTLDKFLNKLENPDFRRTVFDKQTGQDIRLSDEDLEIAKRLMGRRVPQLGYNMYEKFEDIFSHEVQEMPLSGRPDHKRSFIPSKSEAAYVAKRALQIRQNKIKYNEKKKEIKRVFSYDLWHDEGTKMRGIYNHMPAPKRRLPGHGESYRPPIEYLSLDPKAREARLFPSIRKVPAYSKYIQEQWDRCLNLYLAPRQRVRKIQASSTDLIPLLPKPQDLRPFPTQEALVFKGHNSIIRTISVHPLGKYLASGSDDRTVKIWETSTGRCLRSFDVEGAVKCVSWNPSSKLFLLGVAFDNNLVFINPETYLVDKIVVNQTNQIFRYEPDQGDYIRPDRVVSAVKWRTASADEWAKGYRIIVEHFRNIKEIVWHKQGDYFATVVPEGDHRSVLMHQLSRWRSQVPFNKCKGRIQTIAFHPKLPFLYVVTQTHVRVYNLLKQQMTKKVQANCRWISSIAVHPGGEHFLIGGYDRKLNWFEMECTRRPHLLRYHKSAVRSVAYHRKYPLFASAADEGRVIVCHGMVYNDWVKDPLIVPLKELKGHRFFDDLYVLDIAWHPFEAYLFTAGADATIRLWH